MPHVRSTVSSWLLGLAALFSAATASFAETPTAAIEELTFWVRAESRDRFVEQDREIWTATLARQPGFLGKQTWFDDDDPTAVKLVIRWRTLADWRAVPDDVLAEADRRFRQAMGEGAYRMTASKAYSLRDEANAAKGEPRRVVELAQLLTHRWLDEAKDIAVANDPVYHADKRYRAISLAAFLDATLDLADLPEEETTLVFACSDDYQRTMSLAQVRRNEGWLAVRDLDAPAGERWAQPAGGDAIEFAPCYLVWPDAPRSDPSFAWPYALTEIRVERE